MSQFLGSISDLVFDCTPLKLLIMWLNIIQLLFELFLIILKLLQQFLSFRTVNGGGGGGGGTVFVLLWVSHVHKTSSFWQEVSA